MESIEHPTSNQIRKANSISTHQFSLLALNLFMYRFKLSHTNETKQVNDKYAHLLYIKHFFCSLGKSRASFCDQYLITKQTVTKKKEGNKHI